MPLSKFVKYSLALLVFAFILSEPTFKSHPRPLSLTADDESSSKEQGTDSRSLPSPGKSTTRELSTGGSHSYQITLGTNQFLHVIIEPQGIDAGVILYAPDGRMLVQLGCRYYGPTPVSVVAEVSGVYRLEVRSLEREQARGRYELRVEEIRPALAKDKYRIAAEKAFAEGENLLKEWKAESSRKAIDKFKDSLLSWKAAGDQLGEALTLKRIGDVYQALVEYQNALTFYNQALPLSRRIKDRQGESEVLNEVGYVYLTLGDNQKALNFCNQALTLSQVTNSQRARARAINNLGEISYGSGKLQQSIDYYQQALSIWREIGDRQGQAIALLNFGYTYSDLGQMQEALSVYNQAHSIFLATSNNRGHAMTLTAIGRLYSRMGESQEALSFFQKAIQLVQVIGDPIEEARILNGIAYIYDQLGEKQKAIGYYNQALPLFRAAKYSNGESMTLYDVGRAYYSLGDNQQALDHYQQALLIFRAIGERRLESLGLREVGRVHDSLGDKVRALGYYNKALSFWQSDKDFREMADTLNPIGHIYEEWGQKQKALEYYAKALPLNRQAEYPYGEAATLHNIARVERDSGNLARARARAEEALKVVESLRTKVNSQDLRASYFASARQQYEFYIDLLMRLHRERPTEGFDTVAFEASERSLARSLLETLADARVGVRRKADPALLERASALREELNDKAARRRRLQGGDPAEAEAATLDREIDELTSRLNEVEAQIRAGSLEHTASLQTRPLSLRAIQEQVVDDGTLLLEYSLGEEKSYLWAVTKTSIRSYELPGRAEIETIANRVRSLLTAPQPIAGETLAERQARIKQSEEQYWREAAVLGRMLLAPVAEQLTAERLLIVPDGALQYIPFNALPVTAGGNEEPVPLMLGHEITLQPSASALASLRSEMARRSPAPKMVAVFADPVFEQDDSRLKAASGQAVAATQEPTRDAQVYRALRDVGVTGDGQSIPRLFASRDEAKAIMAVTPAENSFEAIGFDANKATATSAELSHYRIIHFATHGVLDSEQPELSGLVLSLFDKQGRPQDGFLRLNDIYNLDLPAELVVLSACNTGLGKDVKGEGLVGLVRGFMYAGTTRVMASLWKVDDEATAELMRHFYREMLKENKSPAAALRGAQIAMWRQKRWRSPYFWAAFVLQGEYQEKIKMNSSLWRITAQQVGVAVAVLLSILFSLYVWRQRIRRSHEQ